MDLNECDGATCIEQTRRSKIVEITYFCFFKEEEQNKATREKRPTEFLLFVDVMGD
jgi:hypothetical protein